MKKFTREERKAWIEKGKTAFIVFLCFCCVYLVWSVVDFYKGQISISQFFWGSENTGNLRESGEASSKNVVQTFWQLSSPDLVAVNWKENRNVILPGNDGYSAVVENVNMLLRDVYSARPEEILAGDSAQWQKALGENSVYVRFEGKRVSAFDAQFYEMRDSSFSRTVTSYSEVLFVPLSSTDTGATAYVKDESSGRIVKVVLNTEISAIKKAISDCVGSGQRYKFGFELDPEAQNLSAELDAGLLIPAAAEETEKIAVRVPRIYRSGINFTQSTEVTAGLINVFGYNPNTVRQYANTDGALIFVAETGSLSLHPEGRIEYKALGENEGVVLTKTSKNGAYSVISGLSELMEKIFSLCGANEERQDAALRTTAFPGDKQPEKNRLELDYFVDGIKVELGDGAAVSAVIENGVLTELKMWVKTVEKIGEPQKEEVFAAIEAFCASNKSVKKITSAKKVYVFNNEEKETSAVWKFQGGR